MIMVTNNDAVQLLLTPKNNNVRQEKPRHIRYLNEFRTQQCMLFLEQQCQFHRPYTCFHWHFPNQKRRRPFKRPDGTFNYNPDVYCDKYDETTGSCVDGDECPYAHRNAGDTERRYHPRYFKTGNCIYETTDNGACVKNGLHCAFAHGPDDIRLPVYDIREVQDASSKFTINLPASLEKERVLSEDPKWNQMFHVLACYKTELCKKPPRMCRQGYSCPFYHNGKDKRRAPDKWRYRSTPCPAVRPGDEWLDSSSCEAGDACGYCHTRTEQQFHPEIYKSTKCNDVINSGYCPRGPFCAFAHCDSELSTGRDFLAKVQHVQLSTGTKPMQMSPPSVLDSLQANLPRSFNNTQPSRIQPSFNYQQTVQNQANPFGQLFERPGYLLPFGQTETSQGLGDNSKRPTQLPTPLIPNLLPPFAPTGNAPGSMVTGRGRRVARCLSPHHGVWQSPGNKGLAAERHVSMPAQLGFPPNMTCGPEPGPGPGPGQHLSTNHLSQFSSMFASRQQTNKVMTNVPPIKSGFTDKGRHRSGNSVCSENGLSMVHRDLALSSGIITSPSSVCTFTYPGRNSAFMAPNVYTSGRLGSGTAPQPPRMLNAQQLLRTGQKLPPQRYHQENEQVCGGPQSNLFTSSPTQNQSDIWSHATSLAASDAYPNSPFTSTPWSWHLPVDSGNNSETSVNDVDVAALLDLPGNAASVVVSSTSLLDASNRDSGLVLDYSLPYPAATDSHHSLSGGLPSDEYGGLFGEPIRHSGGDTCKEVTGPSGKSAQPVRVPSGLFDDLQLLYQCVMSHQEETKLKKDETNHSDAGFQSPLDDILLQAHGGFENTDYSSSILGPITSDSSPLADTKESYPMSIPRRNALEQMGSVDKQSDTSSNISMPHVSRSVHPGDSTAQISPKNTWPTHFTELPATTRSTSNLSSPAASQISQSFSPVVGAPLNRGLQKPIFDLGSSAKSALAGIARDAVSQVSAVSKQQQNQTGHVKTETTSTPSSPLSPGPGTQPHAAPNVNFLHLPQSPILMSSPFSNPRSELERLSLQRELDEVRQRLGSKEHEVEALKRQRDFMTEHLRDSLGVIRQLFSTFSVSSSDVSRPLFVDTEGGTGSGQSTGYSTTGFTNSEGSPLPELSDLDASASLEDDGVQINTDSQTPSTITSLGEKTQLQQQQEALAALFANPFVNALLSSGTLPMDALNIAHQHLPHQMYTVDSQSATAISEGGPSPQEQQDTENSSTSVVNTCKTEKTPATEQSICNDSAFAHVTDEVMSPHPRNIN